MKDDQGEPNNTVSARGQAKRAEVRIVQTENARGKVLFAGNSITLHEPCPAIGWRGDWGMAASAAEKDYVHLVAAGLLKQGVAISYAVVNCAEWEAAFYDETVKYRYERARSFDADVLVLRLGENIVPSSLIRGDLARAAGDLVSYLAPHAHVYVTGLFWASREVDGILRRFAADNGYTFVELGDLGADEHCRATGRFSHAGVSMHPGDEGMQRIADRIIREML